MADAADLKPESEQQSEPVVQAAEAAPADTTAAETTAAEAPSAERTAIAIMLCILFFIFGSSR